MTLPDPPIRTAAAEDRILALDVIRGIALAFMILVHFHQLLRAPDSDWLQGLVGWGVWILVEQKAWGVFALLFGAGLALLARRLAARGGPVTRVLLRRVVALLVVGLLVRHTIEFSILEIYGWWGIALVLMRRRSTPALLATAVASAMARPVVTAAWALYAAAAGRAAEWSPAIRELFVWVVPDVNLALMIVGFLAVRHGVADEPLRHRRLVRGWMLGGAACWAVSWLVLYHVPGRLPIQGLVWAARTGAGLVQDQWLCFTYGGGLLLLLAARPRLLARLSGVGAAGRMAFTNYLLQATVVWFLWRRLDVRLHEYAYVVASAALFAALVVVSRLWLGRFRFGPVEWLWRMATYARREPLRRPRAVSGPALVA